jgi:stage III sporulation protein AB
MLRWIAAVLVVLSSTLIGMNDVIRSRQRVSSLRVLSDALGVLRAELTERRIPLPELLERLAARQRQPAAEFFGTVNVNLVRRELPFSTAWEMALRETESLCLLPEELQAMENLGRQLGKSGAMQQGEAILAAEKKLALFLDLEERERMKKSRLRAAVGAGAGAMLAILLL